MRIKYAFRMPSRIPSRLTLCQAYLLERAPIEFGRHMDTPSKNTRTIIFDGICTAAMNAFFAGPFLAAFALALGASYWEIGLISAVVFLSMPMQAVGLYVVDRWKRRRGLVIFCALTARLLWILIACLPFFPAKSLGAFFTDSPVL